MALLLACFSLPLILAAAYGGRLVAEANNIAELRLARGMQVAVLLGVGVWHQSLSHWSGICRNTQGEGGVAVGLALAALVMAALTAFAGGRRPGAHAAWRSVAASLALFIVTSGWIYLTMACDPT